MLAARQKMMPTPSPEKCFTMLALVLDRPTLALHRSTSVGAVNPLIITEC